jgi:L-fuculose-phosphate aldolase
MKSKERAVRDEIVASCRRMNELRINQGTSGNVSARWKDGLLISPSGLPYDEMSPDDIVFLRMDGTYDGEIRPSSEWRFHRDIMRSRPEVNAVVHAHPTYCTVLAIRGMEIPALHYMIAVAGGPNVRCAPYATYGTEELSRNALQALEGRSCCLLANHGMIATGDSLKKAMWLAVELETLARQYVLSLMIGGPNLLTDEEIGNVIERFKDYGPRAKADAA